MGGLKAKGVARQPINHIELNASSAKEPTAAQCAGIPAPNFTQ
jgi:hypothetical protein